MLPDPSCTPGATNPAVTQANIDVTICRSGWTETVRPPESYTEALKYTDMAAYGDTGSAGGYEEDHFIPLELGGSPTSQLNLWPEPGASPNPKDAVEDAAKRAVCDGNMTLAAAQKAIATDWIAFGQQLGVTSNQPAPAASPTPAAAPASTSAAASVPASPAAPAAGKSYKAGEFCPQADIGQTIQSSEGPLTCRVTSSPSHPHWEHS